MELGDRGITERESMALFGLPVSEPAMETNASGDTILTQWFERARFEDHGAKGVLLGLLGNEVRANSGGTPPSSPSPTPAPSTPPAATGIPVLSHTSYTDSSFRHIVGEVQNNTGANAQFVKIVASLYNSTNRLVGTDISYTDLDILTPGQRSPFEIIIIDPPADLARYELQVEWRRTNDQPLGGFVILSQGDRSAGLADIRYIFGEIRNDSGGPARFVKIVATLYNAQGAVVQVASGYTSLEQLAPGQPSPFEVIVLNWNNAARYELQVQGRRP